MEPGLPHGFGRLLQRYRRGADLTQEELAERTGLTATAISLLERGARRRPHTHTVQQLADALGLGGPERIAFAAAARARHGPARSTLTGQADGGEALPPLVGRLNELTLIERRLLAGEGPPLLMLAGEPGIGKSRLLAEARRLALHAGWQVLDGGCQRWGSQEAFEPLLGALRAFVRGRSPAQRRADLHGCAWLTPLLPELAGAPLEGLPSWRPAPGGERRLIGEAMMRLLTNVAGPRGTLLVLDDLQWAERDALELLALLVGAASQAPVRVIGAYRDSELTADHPLSVLLADLAHAGLATHCTLAPLSLEDGRALLRGLCADAGDPALGERVLQRAGGVPFVIVSFAQSLAATTYEGAATTSGSDVPWDVAQSVRQRIAALPDMARGVMATAAVAGRLVSPSVLSLALERPEDDVLWALDAARRAALLIDDVVAGYRFAHDIIREVIEADLGTARRRAAHRKVAAAIEAVAAARPSDQCEALAYHYLQAAVPEKALTYLVQAADKALAAGATHDALSYYEQAQGVCAMLEPAADEVAATVSEKCGFVRLAIADFARSAEDFRGLCAVAQRLGDAHRAALAGVYRAMPLYFSHDFAAAEDAYRDILATAGTFTDVCFLGSVGLGELLTVTGRHAEAAPPLAIAEELAPHVDSALGQGWWANFGGFARHWQGDYDEAIAFFARWRGVVDAGQDLSLRLWIQWEEALAYGGKGAYEQALASLHDVIALCDRVGEAFVRARALNSVGWIYGELQDHCRALELNTQSLEAALEIEVANPEIQNNARLNLGDTLRALGRPAEAEAYYRVVEETVRDPRPQDHFMLWRYAQHLLHSYGEWWLQSGDPKRAWVYARECLDLAQRSASKKNIVKARRLLGQVLLAEGALVGAAAELASALEVARQIGNPPQHWRTCVALGGAYAAQGHRDDERAAYREAVAVIDGLAAIVQDAALRHTFQSSEEIQHARRLLAGTHP